MNIAILSMQDVINYGSFLQAYSLKEILKDLNNNVKIDFLKPDLTKLLETNNVTPDQCDYKKKNIYSLKTLSYKIYHKLMYQKFKKMFLNFQNEYIHSVNLPNYKKYDLLVIGSDEVFKCQESLMLSFYGDIACSKTIISYAASCGSATILNIPKDKIPFLKETVSNFNAISVRDNGTKKYIENFTDKKINYNLDPVLVGPLSFRKIGTRKIKEPYIVVYGYSERINDENQINFIKRYAKKHKCKIVCVGGYQRWCMNFMLDDPFSMLDLFYYADFIFTDTFHGIIFSVINKKNFCAFSTATNYNKVTCLLNDLGLENRLFNEKFEFDLIDYEKVFKIISNAREETYDYLMDFVQYE